MENASNILDCISQRPDERGGMNRPVGSFETGATLGQFERLPTDQRWPQNKANCYEAVSKLG